MNLQSAIEIVLKDELNKAVISNPRNKTGEDYKKIVFLLKEIKGKMCYQIEKYTSTQVFHENIELTAFEDALIKYASEYKQINAMGLRGDYEIKINKKGDCILNKSIKDSSTAAKMIPMSNNRKKNYLLEEGMNIPVFVELGIFTKEYKVVNSKFDKFKQINRFIELVDDVLKTYAREEINIIDFGCGKSYLTFIMYYYLVEIRHIKANIIGLDLKADVISKCNELSKKYGYDSLRFEVGNIDGFKAPFDVDMVVTLHACDTATDFALINAINWNAKFILSVPCCQHEINKQISSDSFSLITKYGIVKERVSALITDAIRGSVLEYKGYKVDLLEFIDIDHSPKNIMIRARKANLSEEKRKKSLEQALAMAEEFNFKQTLLEECGK